MASTDLAPEGRKESLAAAALTGGLLVLASLSARAGVTISQWTDYTYGVTIQSPWAGGGYVNFNYPEHFQYTTSGLGILRHSDAGPNKWVILDAGARATLDVMSPSASGVRCESELLVNGNTVETWWRVTNNSGSALAYVHGLFCMQYRTLTDFPTWTTPRFPYTHLLVGGGVTGFDQLTFQVADPNMRTALVWNSPITDNPFAEEAEEKADCGFIGIRSTATETYVAMMWEYGREVFSNRSIPCAHADPLFGDLPDGQFVTRYGKLVFHEGPLDGILPARPTAVIEIGNPGQHLPGEAVQFIGSNSTDDGAVVGYAWDFGDDGTSTQADPSHSYAADGIRTVGLTVVDNYSLTGETTLDVTIGVDGDADGLPDSWETSEFGNLDEDASGDPDEDLLSNYDECRLGTDPEDPDTDGDGLLDGEDPNPLKSDRGGGCGCGAGAALAALAFLAARRRE